MNPLPSQNVVASVAALQAEIDRLRQLIRSAFEEGWVAGNRTHYMSDATVHDPESEWDVSDAKKELGDQ